MYKKKLDVLRLSCAALFTDQFCDKGPGNVQTVKQKIVLNSSQNDIKFKSPDKMKGKDNKSSLFTFKS